jgi:hypothetical protein
MAVGVCDVAYQRPDATTVHCTFIKGHSAEHSWRTLRLQDQEDAVSGGQYDLQVGAFLEAVACGDLDKYLEAILAGCHERKRARRSVWTPPGKIP